MAAHRTSSADGSVKLRLSGSENDITGKKPVTTMEALAKTAKAVPQHTALAVKRGDEWTKWTYEQYYQDVRIVAKAFIALGLEPRKAVCIIGFNSPEWFIADLAAIFAGGFASGIYTTNTTEACEYVAGDSEANIIVVEDHSQLEKFLQCKDRLPHVKAIVQYIGEPIVDGVLSWKELCHLGAAQSDKQLERRINAQKVNECCTLIYTSGTTGNPKGVMLSHDNITWTASAAQETFGYNYGEEVSISYLPLSHIAAQMIDIHGPIYCGGTVYFARPDALKGTLGDTLKEVRPTRFFGVPRVWEKIADRMQAIGRENSFPLQMVGSWAKSVGLQGNLSRLQGLSASSTPWGWTLAQKLVFNKVREALGLDRCKLCLTGAAPITRETLEYFLSINIPIYELYGMSECSGPQTVSLPGKWQLGSCGKVLNGAEMKLAAGTNEILFRGRHIFMGYLNQKEKTEDTLDNEGWLHSGDVGRMESGFLYITGRIKEILVTAGGENIPPVLIENKLKAECPVISNAVVIGDKRRFLSCLITLKEEINPDSGEPTGNLDDNGLLACKAVGSNARTVKEAISDPKVQDAIHSAVERCNASAISNAQRIAKWTCLPKDFSLPGGELGPTLKLKRKVVYEKYHEVIEKFYIVKAKL